MPLSYSFDIVTLLRTFPKVNDVYVCVWKSIWLALSPSRQNRVGYAVSVVVLSCVYSSRRMVCGWFGLRVTMTRKV
jgi:hypothetical protein